MKDIKREQPTIRQRISRTAFEYGGSVLGLGTLLTTGALAHEAFAAPVCKVGLRMEHYYYVNKGGETYKDGSSKFTDPRKDPTSHDEVISPAPGKRWKVYTQKSKKETELTTRMDGKDTAFFEDEADTEAKIRQKDGKELIVPAVDVRIVSQDIPQVRISSGSDTERVFGTNPSNIPCGSILPIQFYEAVDESQVAELRRKYNGQIPTPAPFELLRTPITRKDNDDNDNIAAAPTPKPPEPQTPTLDPRIIGTLVEGANLQSTAIARLEEQRNQLSTRVATLQPAVTPRIPLQPPTQAPVISPASTTSTATSPTPESKPSAPLPKPVEPQACVVQSVTSNKVRVGEGDLVKISVNTSIGCDGKDASLKIEEADLLFNDPIRSLGPVKIVAGKADFMWNSEFPGNWFEYGIEEMTVIGELVENPQNNSVMENNIEVAASYYPDIVHGWVGWIVGPLAEITAVMLVYDGFTHLMHKGLVAVGSTIRAPRFKGRVPLLKRIY